MSTTNEMNQIVTPAVKSLVSAYLLARTYAEVQRERVDEIHLAILTECPILDDETGEPLLRSKDLYRTDNEALCADFYAEADKRLREAGIKPASMPTEFCPALVAEHELVKIERMLIDESGKPLGVDHNKLLCARHGMENWRKWIDLVVGLIVSLPDFKNPLTGKAA